MKRALPFLVLLPLLGGCFGTMFENRLACSVSGRQAYFISNYGPVGVAAQVTPADSEAVCRK